MGCSSPWILINFTHSAAQRLKQATSLWSNYMSTFRKIIGLNRIFVVVVVGMTMNLVHIYESKILIHMTLSISIEFMFINEPFGISKIGPHILSGSRILIEKRNFRIIIYNLHISTILFGERFTTHHSILGENHAVLSGLIRKSFVEHLHTREFHTPDAKFIGMK